MRKKRSWFDYLNVILLSFVAVVTLYPFLYMIFISLSSSIHVLQNDVWLWPKGFTLDYYKTVSTNPKIITGYKNTIIYTVFGTLLSLIVTGMGAYALAKKELLWRKPITFAIVFTMLFNGGMIPTFLVIKEIGIMNSVWAMVLPGLVATWNLIIMRTFFQALPPELEESGKIDGLTEIGIFARIIIPLSKPVMATIGLFYAVGLWNNFFYALLYLRDADLFPLTVILRNIVLTGQYTSDAGGGGGGDGGDVVVDESLKFATIVYSTLPILLVYPFLQKHFVKGVMIGSVKG
jgi:putative aldouronate transport system permease protein